MSIRRFEHYPEHIHVNENTRPGFCASVVFTAFGDHELDADDAPEVHNVHLDRHQLALVIRDLTRIHDDLEPIGHEIPEVPNDAENTPKVS